MALVLDLSNEPLYQISIFTYPEDVKAFSATNHRIYNVSKPILDKHCLLWAKFELIEDGPRTAFWFWHNLTRSLLCGSQGAPYLRNIKTGFLDKIGRQTAPDDMQVKEWDLATYAREIPE